MDSKEDEDKQNKERQVRLLIEKTVMEGEMTRRKVKLLKKCSMVGIG